MANGFSGNDIDYDELFDYADLGSIRLDQYERY